MTEARREFRRTVVRLGDGDVAGWHREGQGGSLIVLHANGLNAGAYLPFLRALDPPQAAWAFDARGHGRTALPAPPGALRSWSLYADDTVRLIERFAPEPPLTLAGHSMGAVTALLAATRLPVARLVMIEPVIVPDAFRILARTPLAAAMPRLVPIAKRAARRRNGWGDADAARAAYERSRFFGAWASPALSGYLEDGLRRGGQGVALTCDPSWEAASFAAQAHRFWGPLGRVTERGTPTFVLHVDSDGSTVPARAAARLVRSGARVTRMQGDHLLPLHDPGAAASFVRMTSQSD